MKQPLGIAPITKRWKLIFQIALGILSILLAVFFIKHERTELTQVKNVLWQAKPYWLIAGVLLIFFFVAVQGWMYQHSFKAVQRKIPFKVAILLYLKRNFISIFVPAGTITYVLFFNKEIEMEQKIEKSYIYYASVIFSICSILSSVLVAIPAVILLFFKGGLKVDVVYGIFGILVILGMLIYLGISFSKKGWVYQLILKKAPSLAKTTSDLQKQKLDKKQLLNVLLFSCVIECIGIAHLYIAMGALGLSPSLSVAVIGYALVLVILMSSPFLRGFGAVELALTYALTFFKFSAVEALSVVFLFRFFDFWNVMLLGIIAFLFKKDGLFMQLLAPVLLLFLGIVNVLSTISPVLTIRFKHLKDFIPLNVIEFSNTAVLVIGVILIVTAVTLIRGYKNSYYLALTLTAISLIGHLVKEIDYEEVTLAGITIIVLLFQRKSYYKKSGKFQSLHWQYGLIVIASVLVYGIIGFYMLDAKHFNTSFTFSESVVETSKAFILLDGNMKPITAFGRYFIYSINMLGASSILYMLWLLYKKFSTEIHADSSERDQAKSLVEAYGNSSMDYFKTYEDNQFYFFNNGEGFIAFKTTTSYAVVLENPVLKSTSSNAILEGIKEFEKAMLTQNLKPIYYRIPETSLEVYEELGKKKLLLGEDAYVNLEAFSLEGKEAKSLRNAINKLEKQGYVFKVHQAPQNNNFLEQLRKISDSWLKDMKRTELAFSQGYFNKSELKNQTILTVENEKGKSIAFLNVVKNSVPNELNFDLMRKSNEAPNGTMDFLFVNTMQYYKEKGYKTICMGMVPLSGIQKPENIAEQALKLAYKHVKHFSHYRNLRFFKEKFHPYWIKVYVVYNTDLDLINLSSVLNKVMKPAKKSKDHF